MNRISRTLNTVSCVASVRTMSTACSATLFAVRLFAYCFFYYFYFFKSNEYGKRTRAFAA